MVSPAINISNAIAPGSVYLEFWRVLNSDYSPYAESTIDVWNGNAWVSVFSVPASPHISESAWTKVTYDVTAHKNAAFRVRFGYSILSMNAYTVGSWNIDDLRLVPQNCP